MEGVVLNRVGILENNEPSGTHEHQPAETRGMAILVPRAAILLASATDRELLQGPKTGSLQTTDFRLSAQPQKFETKTVTIGYKNGQLLRLRAILARALDLWSWPKGSQLDLGTRMPYGRYLTHAHSHITPAVKFLFFVIFGPFFCPKRVMVSGPQWHYLGQVPPPPSPILRGAR